jgi:ADP-ribosyl-[dinitrogen reductase] hydrolase
MYGRIRGALYALACGDALGATLEFVPRAEIRRRYGNTGLRDLVGGGWLNLPPGATTDDTAMALCVAEGIAAAGEGAAVEAIVASVGERFVRWYESGPPDVGATTALAIGSFRELGSWEAAAARVRGALGDRAAGNGALMRTLPIGFFWTRDFDRMVAVSRAVTRMTHPHPEAEWCSAFYDALIRWVMLGERPDAAMRLAAGALRRAAPDLPHDRLWPHVRSAGRLPASAAADPGAYCVATLIAALWAVLGASGAEDAIVRAANLGGDADTVAAVAGGLAGAWWGFSALPERWVGAMAASGEIERSFADIAEQVPADGWR